MVYEIEDEIDWSDGPLEPQTPQGQEDAADPGCSNSNPQLDDTDPADSLFFAETFEPYEVPRGSPLPISRESKTRLMQPMLTCHSL